MQEPRGREVAGETDRNIEVDGHTGKRTDRQTGTSRHTTKKDTD